MARISLEDILEVVRVDGETGSHQVPRWDTSIEKLGTNIDDAVSKTMSKKTLSDLLDEADQ